MAVGVLKHQGKLVLIQFKRNILTGYWGLPGGKVDAGESIPEAVEREFFEEVELRVTYKELLGVLDEEIITKKGSEHFMMFICKVEALDPVSTKRLEHDEGVIDWFSAQQIKDKQIPIVLSDYQAITRVALGSERGYFYSQLDMSSKTPKLLTFEP